MRPSAIVLAVVAAAAGYVWGRSGVAPEATAAIVQPREPPACVVVTSPPADTQPTREVVAVPAIEGMDPLPSAPGQSVHGRLVDLDGNESAGATVVATSPALVGEQVVITDGNGYFKIVDLPAGIYTLTIYYNNQTFSETDVSVTVGRAAVIEKVLDPGELPPPPPPVIDIGTDVGTVTLDEPTIDPAQNAGM